MLDRPGLGEWLSVVWEERPAALAGVEVSGERRVKAKGPGASPEERGKSSEVPGAGRGAVWPEEEMPASRVWAGECFPGPSWPSQGSWSPDVTETHGILGGHLSVTFTGRVGKRRHL